MRGVGYFERALMGLLQPIRRGWSRLRSEWTKNDGKPWEQWVPGVDLKEAVLIGLLVAVVMALCLGTLVVLRPDFLQV